MKVNGITNLFQAARANAAPEKKQTLLTAGAKSDHAVLSKQALAVIEASSRLRELHRAQQNAENSPEVQQIKAMKKQMEMLLLCSKIAARVAEGDKVPAKDLKFLLENDPKAYQMAMASRKPKKDPKEWESVLPDEEEEQNRTDGESGTSMESAPAPEAAPVEVSVDVSTSGGGDMGGGGDAAGA